MVPARGMPWEGAELPLSPRPAWANGRFNFVTCLAILQRGRDGSARPAEPHAAADINSFCSPCDGGLLRLDAYTGCH